MDPVLTVVGTGSLSGERTKNTPPCGASRAEREIVADERFLFFFFFSQCGAGGVRRTDVLLTLFLFSLDGAG